MYTQLNSIKFNVLTVGLRALIRYCTGSWVLQYSITQEQHNYSTIDDDDCGYDCDDSNGLLTTWLNSLKANLRTTVNPIRTQNTDRKSMRGCLCNQTKNS